MGDGTWFDNPVVQGQLWPATVETLGMTFFSTLFTVILGLPLGLALVATAPRGSWNPCKSRYFSVYACRANAT